ncbi:hypothetical protein P692DRAFT_20870527 [Suillus brevipes Sb2]|nr:hypothetical protein P692DRAFT_20870527 [Suillus brevipes Sb2]
MIEDHRPKPLSEASGSREAAAGESSVCALLRPLSTSVNNIIAASDASFIQSQPHGGFRQTLRKFKKNVTRKVSKRLKRFRHQPPVAQNDTHDGALSNQNIEDASPLHPSNDDKPENPSGCVNEGTPEEVSKVQAASSGVEEILDPQLVYAGLRDAREHTESIRPLEGHVESVASAAKDGPQDLDASDSFQTTYLQPLKMSETVTHESALSNQSIEDASCLRPSNDDKPENPSGCVNQGAPEEVSKKVQAASSGVEEILGPQLVYAGLRDACEHTESMRPLEGHVESVASTAKDGPQNLVAADNFQTTLAYLQPLEMSETITHESALSNQSIEGASRLRPSNDDKPENPGGCVNQGAHREVSKVQLQAASSGVEEILDPQLVYAGLRDACEHTESMRPLEGHVESVASESAAKDGPQDLDASENFQSTYLQPLKISDTVIEKPANVWVTLFGQE